MNIKFMDFITVNKVNTREKKEEKDPVVRIWKYVGNKIVKINLFMYEIFFKIDIN